MDQYENIAASNKKNQKGFQLICYVPQNVHKYNLHKYINVCNQQVILCKTAAKIKV